MSAIPLAAPIKASSVIGMFLTRRGPGHAPCALFLKGRWGDEELTESKELWDMEIESFASVSDVHGKILRVHLQPIGIPRQ